MAVPLVESLEELLEELLEDLLEDELLEDAELSSEDTAAAFAAVEAAVEAELSLVGQAAAAEAAVKTRTMDWHLMVEREWMLQENGFTVKRMDRANMPLPVFKINEPGVAKERKGEEYARTGQTKN